MDELINEMIQELKDDIENGKLYGLKLVKTSNEVIKRNLYGEMYEVIREIVGFDNEKFYLRTKLREPRFITGSCNGTEYCIPDYSISSNRYCDCEAYYNAFNFYDGNILRCVLNFPDAINKKDSVIVDEYQVIRSY